MDIEMAANAIIGAARALGIEIRESRSRLSASRYLTVDVPGGAKGLCDPSATIRVSDHTSTTGTGTELMSVRVDRTSAAAALDLALAVVRFAARRQGVAVDGRVVAPMDARRCFQRTLQGKGGVRRPNPHWIGADA